MLTRLGCTADGISSQEVERRLAANGPNVLPEAKRRSWLAVRQPVASPLIYLLFVAAGIAVAIGKTGDAGVILVVVFVNALLGAWHEGRAERSMEALRKISALRARVLRAGREQLVAARDLVPGDVLLLAAGDAVGADARSLEGAALEAAEAALTGESLPVAKHPEQLPADTLLADRHNMVYSGTHIAAGRGRAVVVAAGTRTEVGRTPDSPEAAVETQDAAEASAAQFGRYVAAGAIVLPTSPMVSRRSGIG